VEPFPPVAGHRELNGCDLVPIEQLAGATAVARKPEYQRAPSLGERHLSDLGCRGTVVDPALSSNYLGVLIGRLVGARLTRRPGRSVALLNASFVITGSGFLLFWLTDQPPLAVLGLFVCGVGIANLYPLSLALTLDAAPGREDRANARTQMVLGLVAAGSPFLLGRLADQYGLATAFSLELVLIGGALLMLWGGLRAQRS
jgi:MFS family permease